MSQLNRAPSLLLLICLLAFPQISETIYTPSLPDLAKALSVPIDAAEFTLSIYFVGFALGVLLFGILADLLGRRKALLLGISIYLVGSLGCAFSNSINFLYFFRLIQAIGASAGSVVTQTILRDLYTGMERNRVFSIATAAISFSPAIGPVMGGLADQLFDWRACFYILIFMGVALLIFSMIYLHETRPELLRSQSLSTNSLGRNSLGPNSLGTDSLITSVYKLAVEMIKDSKVLRYALLIGGCNGLIFSYYAEAPYIFIDLLKLTPSQYGCFGLIIALSFFLASLVSLRLNRLIRPETIIALGAGISCLGSLLLTSLCYFGTLSFSQGTETWTALVLSLFIIFTGTGLMIPNCLSNALSQYRDRAGTAGSILGFGYYCIIAGLTALMGFIHNGSAMAMPVYFSALSGGMLVVSLWNQNASKTNAMV